MSYPTTPPPQSPPPGWQPAPPPSGWWFDGHKWRPPVGAEPTRAQLIAQVPGMLLKLIFLVGLIAVIGVFLFFLATGK